MSDIRNISLICNGMIYQTFRSDDTSRICSFFYNLRHNCTEWKSFMVVDWDRAREFPLEDIYPILVEKGLIRDD